jgi:hypothetical protein
MLAQHITKCLRYRQQATRMRPRGRTGNRSVRESQWMWFSKADDTIAGAAQRRIEPKYDLVHSCAGPHRFKHGPDAARCCAAQTILDLFELLKGNAHVGEFANAERVSKAEND